MSLLNEQNLGSSLGQAEPEHDFTELHAKLEPEPDELNLSFELGWGRIHPKNDKQKQEFLMLPNQY